MTRATKGSDRIWVGVLGSESTSAWVKHELAIEEIEDEVFAPPEARPVSVRVEPETIAMLDAFAQRFRLNRSGMLLQLIRGGLADAFHALPEKEQERVCKAASAIAAEAGWKIRYGTVAPAVRVDGPPDEGEKA